MEKLSASFKDDPDFLIVDVIAVDGIEFSA